MRAPKASHDKAATRPKTGGRGGQRWRRRLAREEEFFLGDVVTVDIQTEIVIIIIVVVVVVKGIVYLA